MLPFVERGPKYPTKPRGKMQESFIHDCLIREKETEAPGKGIVVEEIIAMRQSI
jgi:hypothetical protein